MYEIILKARYLNKDYQKALKKILHFFFQVIKNKRGLKLVTSHYLDYETSSEKFLY